MNELKSNQLKLKISSRVIYIMILMFYCSWTNLYASSGPVQDITITGTVVSEGDNLPLPGVGVIIKGTSIGVSTDFDGNYSITVPSSESILVFSFMGFKSKEVMVSNQTIIDITLQPDVTSLDEVVLIGYGTRKKETLTGAIEHVKSDVFEDRAVSNPALALQGQSPGLTVTRKSPRAGDADGISLQIRGATSVNGGSPLIIMDGVAVSGSEFYNMNPDDIASISILKDASAAIYGSRAANGVLLINTKKGKGAMKVEYKGSFRYNTIGIRPPTPSMQEYATLYLEAGDQDGLNDYWNWGTRENLEAMQRGEEGIYSISWGDVFIGNANRFDELFGNSNAIQHNLNISGSTEKTRYRMSAGFSDTESALKTAYDGQKLYNIRFNYDFDVTEKLSIQSGMSYQRAVKSGPSTGLGINAGSYDPPFFPAKNPYGQWYANFNIAGNRNSSAATTDGGRKNIVDNITKINLSAKYEIIENLDFTANASFSTRSNRRDEYRLTVQPYTWNGEISAEKINSSPLVVADINETTYQSYGTFLNYKFTDDIHTIRIMTGVTAELEEKQRLFGERQGLEDMGIYDLNVAPIDNSRNIGGKSHWGIYSVLSRLSYDYKQKYLIDLIGRRDGSSKFAPGYKFSNFGSVSAGWIITKEGFMEDTFVDYLKLKGSYGSTGNQVGIGMYDYVSQLKNGNLPFGYNPTLQNTISIDGLTSTDRTWEKVFMQNIGLEFGFIDNKLTGSFDYFVKENRGMLINVEYPSVLGGTAPKSNKGNLVTKGWEAIVSWKDQIGEFSYNVSVNMADYNNELIRMDGAASFQAGKVKTRVGYPINSWFLYKTDGFFQTQEEIDTYYATYTHINQGELPNSSDDKQLLRIGDTRKVDLDGNGYIDDIGGEGDSGDVYYAGDASPHYMYGINFGGKFKQFDFTAQFQGVLEQKIMRKGYMRYPFVTTYTNQTSSYLGKTWTAENTGAAYPRLTINSARAKHNWNNNDFLLQDNRYIRLKNVVVGYTIPSKITQKISLDRVRLYFSGNDLFELTSVKDGYDPEFGESTESIYPYMRTWSFGLNLTF